MTRRVERDPAAVMAALVPPTSPESERAVLAAVLLDPYAFADVEHVLDAGDFADRRHQLVWEAMTELHGEGVAIDLVTLQERLERRRAFPGGGTAAFLAGLDLDLPDLSRIATYAAQVRTLSKARQVMCTAQLIVQRVAAERDPEAIRDHAIELQRLVDESTVEVAGGPFAERVAAAAGRLRAVKAGDRSAGLRTGMGYLDGQLAGIGRRELVVVAGYTGQGKTTLLEQWIYGWVTSGIDVLSVSLEMGAGQMEDRHFAREMRRSPRELRLGRFTAQDLDAAERELAAAEWAGRLVELFPTSTEIRDVVAQVRAAFRQRPAGVVVVDHLMELKSRGARDRRDEVSAGVAAMKQLARELDVPVILPTQINREGGRGADQGRAPRMWDLGESVEVERRADTILLLWASDPDASTRRTLRIEKARQGEEGFEVELDFNVPTRAYREVGPAYQGAPAAAGPPRAPWRPA